MFRSLWLRKMLDAARSRNDRHRLAARSRKPIRLVLELLEERLTPSGPQTAGSYTDLVNAIAADTGSGINYVIQITNNFTFDSGEQVSISNLGSGSTLTIEGQNGTNYTLTGNGNRLFTVAKGQTVAFEDLSLTGGTVTIPSSSSHVTYALGGAILDQGGNVTLSKAVVEDSTVTGFRAEGGGIFVSAGGELTIENGSTIQSNRALGTGTTSGVGDANTASGGGIFVSCIFNAGTLTISDSVIRNNTAEGGQGANGAAPGADGGPGGDAYGGGVFVTSVHGSWKATLTGDTFSGNAAVGGSGGDGAAGSNATAPNTRGGIGGQGGRGGLAIGGVGEFNAPDTSGQPIGTLTILNDSVNSSIMIDNSALEGSSGNGGKGGTSTGTANNSSGGPGGVSPNAYGGAIDTSGDITVNIGNTTVYANTVTGGNGGAGGAAGTGGSGAAGTAGGNSHSGGAYGGAISLDGTGSVTMVNSTVAKNTATAGLEGGGATQGTAASGGGIWDNALAPVTLDNNTITQNTISARSSTNTPGAGLTIENGTPTLINNLLQGNQGIGSSAFDLTASSYPVTLPLNATNNLIGNMTTNAVSTTTNIIGNSQAQLDSVVGVDSNGNPTGGPIYYPLLSGTASVGAGSTSDLSTIASVEGTTSANTTDEINDPRTTSGSIDLGAVQFYTASAPAITSSPKTQMVTVGASVTFTASASGTPVPWVQWQVSSDGGSHWTNISGATSATLTLTGGNVGAVNGDEFRAVFTNAAGSIPTTAATLIVQFAPTVTMNPSSQAVTAGGDVSFTVAAGGNPTPAVQWQYSIDGGKTFTDLNGATGTTIVLYNVTTAMSGHEYEAVFTNSVGHATTSAATLTVNPVPPPPPSPPPAPPVLNVPPLLAFFDSLLGGTEAVNANGTETITDSFFGLPLIVSTFDSHGDLVSVTLFGFNITFLFV